MKNQMKSSNLSNAPKVSPIDGVTIIILGNTSKMMLTYIVAKPGALVPIHDHPHDQIGTCIKGKGELFSGEKIFETLPGTSWTIPGGESHYWKNTNEEDTILIECFAPPREDYLSKAK